MGQATRRLQLAPPVSFQACRRSVSSNPKPCSAVCTSCAYLRKAWKCATNCGAQGLARPRRLVALWQAQPPGKLHVPVPPASTSCAAWPGLGIAPQVSDKASTPGIDETAHWLDTATMRWLAMAPALSTFIIQLPLCASRRLQRMAVTPVGHYCAHTPACRVGRPAQAGVRGAWLPAQAPQCN